MSATRDLLRLSPEVYQHRIRTSEALRKRRLQPLVAADEPEIEKAAASLREGGIEVEALQADLATIEGVHKLYAAARGREVDALLANR
jgi:short-subunit dehydrogenase